MKDKMKDKRMKTTSNFNTWTLVAGGVIALCLGSSHASAGELQNLLDKSKAFAALPKVRHTPAFRVERFEPVQFIEEAKGKEWYYICDGQEQVGMIQTWTKEIEMFRFSPHVAPGTKFAVPEIYTWANMHGARIQMHSTQMLPPLTSFKLTFTKDRGETLELRVEHRHQGDMVGSSEYRLGWDERLGYVWTCMSRFAMPQPKQIEFNNLLAGGVSESRVARKRWQKTMRGRLVDGRISFVYHNPVHVPRDDLQAGGFVGYITEEAMNPFVEMLETSDPVHLITCSQWYDQHLILKPPQAKAADGLYHAQASYRFLSVPGAVARDLEAMAVERDGAAGESQLTGFLLNQVNDFETGVPRGKMYIGPIWQHVSAAEGPAHSGKKSIAVRGLGPGKMKSVSPIGGGPALYVESNKRYRLAAWVKTKGLEDGGAWLQADDVFFNWEDIKATRRTEKLAGDHDWTRLQVEFTPSPREPLLNIKLCAEGTGTAWFDDLELMELKP